VTPLTICEKVFFAFGNEAAIFFSL